MPATWTYVADIAKEELVKRLRVLPGKEVRTLFVRLNQRRYDYLCDIILPELLIKQIRARYPLMNPGKVARMIRRHFMKSDDVKALFTGETT